MVGLAAVTAAPAGFLIYRNLEPTAQPVRFTVILPIGSRETRLTGRTVSA